MGYKCEDEIVYNGKKYRTGHCETCKYENLAKSDEPCKSCINSGQCPMYSYSVGAEQCEKCKWEEKEDD